MLRFTDRVRINGMKPEMVPVIMILSQIDDTLDTSEKLYITSISDGTHSRNSLHYVGFAIDADFDKPPTKELARNVETRLRAKLTIEYDVIAVWKADGSFSHFHIEFQPETNMRV